ncbi:hypothetical protein [Primorskyibacter sp. 2E233]|uniref:hypothetical protein n=1 Tax=Primorskyibacter sp. 2E233 TaxID=3413431 RepID=UPI003BF0BB09
MDGAEITKVLTKGGIDGLGYKAYSPNGTQIGYTLGGDGTHPAILAHSMMEAFA